MSVYQNPEMDKIVAIDGNHAFLTTALVSCRKPKKILELGFGAGESCRSILNGLRYNGNQFNFTLVDNWLDFGGIPPEEIKKQDYEGVTFVTSGEQEYVFSTKDKFDFIFSDADHFNTQEWFIHVYENLLNKEGILIYHDVTNSSIFPNLLRIYSDAIKNDFHHMLFNYNSRSDEKCDRGLLIIFKH